MIVNRDDDDDDGNDDESGDNDDVDNADSALLTRCRINDTLVFFTSSCSNISFYNDSNDSSSNDSSDVITRLQ